MAQDRAQAIPNLSELKTVAEASNYQATSNDIEVETFLKTLDLSSSNARLESIGKTAEGRSLHALIVGQEGKIDLPLPTDDPRIVLLCLGNIHSGECDGKEAILALARNTIDDLPRRWQERLVLIFVPNLNADGNQRVGLLHRPGQDGPARGMGTRENAQNLDLNRDFIKLETPEVRSLVRAIDAWNVDILIDTHTTNGSLHRYPLTYDIPHNPASPAPLLSMLRDRWIPQVTERMKKSGIDTFYYGNFDREFRRWETYGHEPRYSTEYMGLRGRIGILSESYSYASYQKRIEATYRFLETCIDMAAENSESLRAIFEASEQRSQRDGLSLSIRAKRSDETTPVEILGYAFPNQPIPPQGKEIEKRPAFPTPAHRHQLETLVPTTIPVELANRYVSSLDIRLPSAYLFPIDLAWVAERLKSHGVVVQQSESVEFIPSTHLTQYELKSIKTESVQGLTLRRLEVERCQDPLSLRGPHFVVSTKQPLGPLAGYLLEPESDENLGRWKFMDGYLREGKPFPIVRLEKEVPQLELHALTTIPKSERWSLERLFEPGFSISLGHGPIAPLRWLNESTEYLVERPNQWFAVDAATGSMRPFDRLKRLESSLSKLEAFSDPVQRRAASTIDAFKNDYSFALVHHRKDLYLYDAKTDQTRQITHSPEVDEELATLSPTGNHVAFVHSNNLYLVDCQSTEVRALTQDGDDETLNGILDWFYQEEIYGRGNFKGFWFSPDGSKIAFLKLDESPVGRYQVNDSIHYLQSLEETRYPKSGEPIPTASLMVVDIETKKTIPIALDQYDPKDRLLCRVHWYPNSRQLAIQLQNRIQSYLDLVRCDTESGATRLLFREEGEAWIDVESEPHWLPQGDFLWLSDLPHGRRHLYRVSEDGQRRIPMTQGNWDIEAILLVEEDGKTAWVSGNPNAPAQVHLIRVDLTKGTWQQISSEPGTHRVTFHRSGKYYGDAFSSLDRQPCLDVCDHEGRILRKAFVPTNDRAQVLDLASPKLFTIEARDGRPLQSMLLAPSSLDLQETVQKHPVLIHVYGGPRAPTVKHQWPFETNPWHQYLAQNGIVVLQCDNRSSRGDGNRDTWKIYKEFGRVELQDLEDAVGWLKEQSWVDPDRIGIWGWSYGGYLTAYAMTHSQHFRAGIAGAPVTDWRNYDAIYTERYMDLPLANPEGYRASSVVEAAKNLHGRLLLIHGERDDNVHLSNSLQLAYALQKSGKIFDLMVYPKNRHGITDPQQKYHMHRMMTEFLIRHLVE